MIAEEDQNRKMKSSLSSDSSVLERCVFLTVAMLAIGLRLFTLTNAMSEVYVGVSIEFLGHWYELVRESMTLALFRQMIENFYYSGAYMTLFIMLCGSLIVPMGRITVVLLCYLVPLDERHHAKRENLLFVLDHVGRFILTEMFVSGYGSVFFYLERNLIEQGGQAINVTIGTDYYLAFYAGVFSNIVGSMLTHYLMLKSSHHAPLSGKNLDDKKTILQRLPGNAASISSVAYWRSAWYIWGCVLVAIGSLSHLLLFDARTMSFQLRGVVGEIMHMDSKHYSIWTFVYELPKTLFKWNDDAGTQEDLKIIYFIVLTYSVVIIFVPVALCLASLILLLVPMKREVQLQWLFAFPFWFSWCALDLFFVVSLTEFFELDVLAKYLFHDQYPEICDPIEALLQKPCATVDSKFDVGIVSLGLAVVSLLLIRTRFMGIYRELNEQQVEERLPLLIA